MKWRKGEPSSEVLEKPKGFDDFELRLGDLMRGERATLGRSLLDVQRELKIKATYIAAIENADISAFETPGFVAGYVRSYARYLGMDPEWAYAKFCAEAGFSVAHGMSPAASSPRVAAAKARPRHVGDPLGDPNAAFVPRGQSLLSKIEPGAVGSVLVLLLLIGGIGYGGWSVLREVQRVQVAPIDQAPSVVADIDPLGNVGAAAELRVTDSAQAVEPGDVPSDDALGRLYRPQALDMPVMIARDGPIATINPQQGGSFTQTAEEIITPPADALASPVQVVAEAPPPVEIFAVRPSWVRVQAADGTVLFEKILDAGERYTVPQAEAPARLRAGNSGSLYFSVNGQAFGPAAPGAQVVRNVALSPESLRENYALADLERDPDLARIVAVAQAGTPVAD